jgi:hypothetical protein
MPTALIFSDAGKTLVEGYYVQLVPKEVWRLRIAGLFTEIPEVRTRAKKNISGAMILGAELFPWENEDDSRREMVFNIQRINTLPFLYILGCGHLGKDL